MNFIYHRDRTVSTRQGHTVEFKKGVPTHVPPECFPEILAMGAIPEDDIPEDTTVKSREPADPAERKEVLLNAFGVIKTKNDRDDFNAGGMPSVPAITALVGFKIEPEERDALWIEFLQADPEAAAADALAAKVAAEKKAEKEAAKDAAKAKK